MDSLAPTTGPDTVDAAAEPGDGGAETDPRRRLGRDGWAAAATAAAAMAAIGFWGLDRGSMWRDEEATFDASRRSLPQLLAMVHHVDAVHALYYLLMHFWMLPGGGEVWMRVPSVLGAAAAAGLVAALGTRLHSARAGLFAGLFFAVIPFVSFYAQEGRSYAIVCASVLLATYCLVRAVDTGSRRWWAGYAVASAFAALLHEFAVLALLAHGATLLLGRVPWRVWRRWGVCVAACGVVLAPLVMVSQRQSGQVDWLRRPDWGTVWDLVKLLAGPAPAVMWLFAVLVAVGLTTPWRGRGRLNLVAVALPLVVLPPAALMLASLHQPLYHERYVLFTVAGAPLLAGAGADRLGSLVARGRRLVRLPWLPWLLGAAAVAGVLAPQWQQQRDLRVVQARSEDLAAAARVIRAHARPGDAVLFMPSKYRAVALGYPQAFAGLHDVTLERTPVRAANLRGDDLSKKATRRAMLALDRMWVIGRPRLHVRVDEGAAKNEEAVLKRYFRKVDSYPLYGVEVQLYERRPQHP